MKKLKNTLILFVIIFFTFNSFAQTNQEADKIIGLWQTGSGKGRVQITKYGNKFSGKIVWLRDPNDAKGNPKLDSKNPDVNRQKNTTIGITNLLGFTYEGNSEYDNGTVYDPENGKTYKCIMTLENINSLNVRGYIGFSFIGRTDVWTRVK
jgi:uncharacterized protein (DUF2147 family)